VRKSGKVEGNGRFDNSTCGCETSTMFWKTSALFRVIRLRSEFSGEQSEAESGENLAFAGFAKNETPAFSRDT
jgi:hypothetical protein